MNHMDLYSNAHLFVAAIRILEHRDNTPPLIEDVCTTIPFSLELGNLVCKKLKNLGVIDIIDGAYGSRLCIDDHLKIEEIPQESQESSIQDDLKKFQQSQNELTKKVESIKAKHAKKQEELFAELEQKLKKGLEKD